MSHFDYVYAIGGISDEQGASLRQVLENSRCPFAANGTPGFNVGFSDKARELTTFLQRGPEPREATMPRGIGASRGVNDSVTR